MTFDLADAVAGDHRRREAIRAVISECQSFTFIFERQYRENRPEDFLARNRHRVLHAIEDRRSDEEAFFQAFWHFATIGELGVALAALDIALNAFLLPRRD